MLRVRLQRCLLLAVLAASLLSVSATPADAGCGHWRGCHYGCYPSYVAVYRPVYSYGCNDPCLYGYGYGRAYYGRCGVGCHCSRCYVPCYPSCYSVPLYGFYLGGTRGCCDGGQILSVESATPAGSKPAETATPSDNSVMSPAEPAAPASDAAPVVPPDPAPDAAPAPAEKPADESAAPPADPPAAKPEDEKTTGVPTNGTILTVVVPADAQVYMNGRPTKTPGTVRKYVSRGLVPGQRYTYEVQAVVQRDGQRLTATRVLQVRAGEATQAAFAFARGGNVPVAQVAAPVATTLTLQVPADAQVVLAGNPTEATGSVRRFTTTGLARGAAWEDYRVVVTAVRQGQPVTQEKTLRLTGGESQVVSFDFDADGIAAR